MSSEMEEFGKTMLEFFKRKMHEEMEDTKARNTEETAFGTRSVERLIDTSASVAQFAEGTVAEAEQWLRELILAKRMGKWSEDFTKSVLVVKLTGSAKLWHMDSGVELETFEEWKKEFEMAFVPRQKKGALVEEFLRCRQGRGESVESYIRKKNHLAKQLDFEQSEIKEQILKGLSPEYTFLIQHLRGREHSNITELIRDIDDSMDLERSIARGKGNTGSTSRVENRAGRGQHCFVCGREGHKQAWCPEKRQDFNHQDRRGGRARYEQGAQGNQDRGARVLTWHQSEAHGPSQPRSSTSDARSETSSSQPRADSRNCYKCQRQGHIARDCREVRRVETLDGGEDERRSRGIKTVVVNGREWSAKVDTEAEVSVISERSADELELKLSPSRVTRVRGIGGACVPIGQTEIKLETDGLQLENVTITVLPTGAMSSDEILLGKDLLDKGLVTVYREGQAWLLKEEAFEEIAKVLPRIEPKIQLAVTAEVKLAPRSVCFVTAEPVQKGAELIIIEDQSSWGALCRIEENRVVIPVANFGTSEINLSAGTVVARATTVEKEGKFFNIARKSAEVNQICTAHGGKLDQILSEDVVVQEGVLQRYRVELVTLLNEYRDVVATSMKELGRTSLTEFEIEEMVGSSPVRCRPFRLSATEKEALKEIITQLSEAGMIEKSQSSYASPVMLVKKADGGWRMVIDYRKLNAQTVKLNYPLPLIDDILDEVGGRRLYSTFDLAWGYFQIPMAKEASEKAAFVTAEGHFQPKVLMMGLCNAPAKFQELMVRVKNMVGGQQAYPFLDDLITASDNYEEHLAKIANILGALRKAGLTVRLSKCKFFMHSVQFLGFKISEAGIQPGTRKLLAVEQFPTPTNVHEVRRFLGLTSFFRRFIRNYAMVSSPLTALLKKKTEFKWDEKCNTAVEQLKAALGKDPILERFVLGRPIELHTDASCVGLGAILLQKVEGAWKMVYAISRKLSESEKNYHSTKLEQLAVIWSMERLRHYLYGQHFTVVSDCSAVAVLQAKSGSPQINRWLNRISEFDFSVKHRSGTSMGHVDALSRDPFEEGEEIKEADLPMDSLEKRVYSAIADADQIAMIQATDEEVKERVEIFKKAKDNRSVRENNLIEGFKFEKGILFRVIDKRKLYVLPKHSRKYVLVRAHDNAGHFGMEKTLEIIRRTYWFPKMREYVKYHLQACLECIFNKNAAGKKEGICRPIRPERRPFQKVFIDHLGHLPKSNGKEHVIVMVDGLTKFVLLEAVSSTSTAGVIKFLSRVFMTYGNPEKLVSDRGTAFTSKVFEDFLIKNGVQHILISTQHPQSNGQVERINREVARLLRTLCTTTEKKDWALRVPEVQMMLNRVVSRSTGKAPFEVLHGYLPRLDNFAQVVENEQESVWRPAQEVQREIRDQIINSQNQYAYYYDQKRKPHYIRYSVGDIVVVSRLPIHTGQSTKLQPKFRGPMVITEVLPNDSYRLLQLGSKNYGCTAHCSQLRWYRVHGDDGDNVIPLDDNYEDLLRNGTETQQAKDMATEEKEKQDPEPSQGSEDLEEAESINQSQEKQNASKSSDEELSAMLDEFQITIEPGRYSTRRKAKKSGDLNMAMLESPEPTRTRNSEFMNQRREQPTRETRFRGKYSK